MTDTRIALLPDRGVVTVMGEDAEKLLQGVITNDMALLNDQPAIHAGLLTPQGRKVKGWPVGTIVRGVKVMWDGEIVQPARGEPVVFFEGS